MSELFEQLPEAGDLDKPKLVFFFDEAHLLFNEAPKVLLEKIEQVVRLVRSKGVGIYFVTQNPDRYSRDRAWSAGKPCAACLTCFYPQGPESCKIGCRNFQAQSRNSRLKKSYTELGVGEALVSFLDEKGIPGIVERAKIVPPQSQIGPILPEERNRSDPIISHLRCI